MLIGDIFFGMTSLIATIVLIPPVRAYIEDAFGFKLSGLNKFLMVLIIFVVQLGYTFYMVFSAASPLITEASKSFSISQADLIRNATPEQQRAFLTYAAQLGTEMKSCNAAMKSNQLGGFGQQNCQKAADSISKLQLPTNESAKVNALLKEATDDYYGICIDIQNIAADQNHYNDMNKKDQIDVGINLAKRVVFASQKINKAKIMLNIH